MKSAKEVIANWIYGELPFRSDDCNQMADELLDALEAEGHAVRPKLSAGMEEALEWLRQTSPEKPTEAA